MCAIGIPSLCLDPFSPAKFVIVQVRKLAAEVYGAHEQNGNWNDDGEWHVVGDEDLESSDDDLLGSDVESSSDDNEDHDGHDVLGLAGDDSSGDDYDSMDDEDDDDGQGTDGAAMLSDGDNIGNAPFHTC